jgi:hypothetical protein
MRNFAVITIIFPGAATKNKPGLEFREVLLENAVSPRGLVLDKQPGNPAKMPLSPESDSPEQISFSYLITICYIVPLFEVIGFPWRPDRYAIYV